MLGCGILINHNISNLNIQKLNSTYSIPVKNKQYYKFVSLNTGTYDLVYIDSDYNINFSNNYNSLSNEWSTTTLFFAKFDGNLFAGNLDFSIKDLNYILIMKRELNSSNNLLFKPFNIIYQDEFLENKKATIIDRLVRCNKEYEYKAIPVLLDGTESSSLNAVYLNDKRKVKWTGHYIYDGVSEWHTDIQTSLEWNRNRQTSTVNTIKGKYPFVFSLSENNYDTISITSSHFKVMCNSKNNDFDFENNAEYNRKYDDFITNDNAKLIRDWSGRMWIAKLENSVEHSMNNNHNNISTTHTFIEIADCDDIDTLYQYGFTKYNSNIMINGNIAEEVKFGATIEITVKNNNNVLCENRQVTILLNNIEVWKCNTNLVGKAVVNNLEAGFYTIIVDSGVYATKKYISISSNNQEIIPIEIKVGV